MAPPPPSSGSRRSALYSGAFLVLAACATSARPPPPAAGAPVARAGAPLERCAAAPAPGTRCADVVAALGGIGPGSAVRGGRVAELAVAGDRVLLSLAADGGEVAGVDLVRLDPAAPPPPARAGALGLYLRSDAPGAPTPAWQLALVQALADAMPRDAAPPPWLAGLGRPPAR